MPGRRSRLAARRRQLGLSQETLAELVGVGRGTVARWERGEGEMYVRHRRALAAALETPLDQLDPLLFGDNDSQAAVTGLSARPIDLTALTLTSLAQFRLRDQQTGGGGLYGEVVEFLAGTLGPHCFGVFDSGRAEVFAATASVTEMAGWMAYESGDPRLAGQHFDRAQDLASLGGDPQLSAHIAASRSHLSTETGSARRALMLARSGQDGLSAGPPAPELQAKLLMYEARSAGQAGEVERCRDLMRRAEVSLATATSMGSSPWLSPFDEASLANEMAQCHLLIGDYSEAARQAEAVLAERPPDRSRSRAFAGIALAKSHVERGDHGQARSATATAAEEARPLRSSPIEQRLAALDATLGFDSDP